MAKRSEKEGKPLLSREAAFKAARAALSKKADNVVILDLDGLTIIADYFIVCSGDSTTQVKAIAEHVAQEFAGSGIRPLGIEGMDYGHWVLLDYGDVIVHVFERETREYYNLEKLWMDAVAVEVDEDTADLGGKDARAVR